MREPGAEPTEGDQPRHRSQRPSQRPSAPLTHQMDLHAVRAAYWREGIEQPELEKQRPVRADRQITRPKQTAATEEKLMETESNVSSTKPTVGGTQSPIHNAKVTAVVSEGQKCLMYGGTAVVTGSILMLAWKGITRWLG